jgi:hypothetical protein
MTWKFSVIPIVALFLFAGNTSGQSTVYECEIKEALHLTDDGTLRPYPRYPRSSRRFMVDKTTGVAVGDVFVYGDLIWRLNERGSKEQSFKTVGHSSKGELLVTVAVMEFREGRDKPFVLNEIGIGAAYTGLCK